MASVKKGILTESPEWWKHLRWAKRVFWRRERRAQKRDIVSQVRALLSAERESVR